MSIELPPTTLLFNSDMNDVKALTVSNRSRHNVVVKFTKHVGSSLSLPRGVDNQMIVLANDSKVLEVHSRARACGDTHVQIRRKMSEPCTETIKVFAVRVPQTLRRARDAVFNLNTNVYKVRARCCSRTALRLPFTLCTTRPPTLPPAERHRRFSTNRTSSIPSPFVFNANSPLTHM